MAAVAERTQESQIPVSIILQYLTNINMNDKIEFNEEFDTYIAFFEHQANLVPVTFALLGSFWKDITIVE